MELWQLWCLIGIIFFIVEMFTPVMFFLNLGLAALSAAIAGYFGGDFTIQVIVFAVFAAIFLIWLRPFLIKKKHNKDTEFDEKYKDKIAIVTEKITSETGRIAIYGETWQAVSMDGSEIDVDERVKIIKIDSIVMYVERI